MASGAALQMYIFNVTQKCCRAIRAGFWPDCGRNFCWYGEMALDLVAELISTNRLFSVLGTSVAENLPETIY